MNRKLAAPVAPAARPSSLAGRHYLAGHAEDALWPFNVRPPFKPGATGLRIYGSLHAPMAIIDGGPSDIAYANGEADFNAITTVPIIFANRDVGHLGTFFEDNGGEFGRAGVGWLKWHLMNDTSASAKGLFAGADCGLCDPSSGWSIRKKQID